MDEVGTAYMDPNDVYANEQGTQPYGVWVYQVAVPLVDLGLTSDAQLAISFGMDCGNDILSMNAIYSSVGNQPVPEPMAMIFFGTGLVGIGGYMARRKMLHQA